MTRGRARQTPLQSRFIAPRASQTLCTARPGKSQNSGRVDLHLHQIHSRIYLRASEALSEEHLSVRELGANRAQVTPREPRRQVGHWMAGLFYRQAGHKPIAKLKARAPAGPQPLSSRGGCGPGRPRGARQDIRDPGAESAPCGQGEGLVEFGLDLTCAPRITRFLTITRPG